MNEATTQPTPQEPSQALARTFPSLRDTDAVERWDPKPLTTGQPTGPAHGEKLAVCFVLNVYNQFNEWHSGRFDVIEAYGVWDRHHWTAFRAWATDPYLL